MDAFYLAWDQPLTWHGAGPYPIKMISESAPNRDMIIGAVVLAFTHSRLKDLTGTDALRSVLVGQYRDLVRDKTLHLQLVWQLLEDQPGFDPEDAKAPFCVLKTWEGELRLSVALPDAIAKMTSTEVVAKSSNCVITRSEKRRLFEPEEVRARAKELQEELTTPPPRHEESTRKPALEALLAVVALCGLGFGGYTLIGSMGGPEIDSVATTEIITEIPIASARQIGNDLDVLVSSESWFSLAPAQRTAMLTNTLRTLKARGITTLSVSDTAKNIRATAQWVGDRVEVRLQ